MHLGIDKTPFFTFDCKVLKWYAVSNFGHPWEIPIFDLVYNIPTLADPTSIAGSSNEAPNYKVTACSVFASVVPCLCSPLLL